MALEQTWQVDEMTASWTKRTILSTEITIAPQFKGTSLIADTWGNYIRAPRFPEYCYLSESRIFSSPENIIRCFQDGFMLEGLALTVGWGAMWRNPEKIYSRDKRIIELALHKCAETISNTNSINSAWLLMRQNLFWSDVMASKCLHFLARSLDITRNPGVAIDGSRILKKFAPLYDSQILRLGGNPAELGNWRDLSSPDASWQAYNRYMTAILTWAEMTGWTTTEVETTIFSSYSTFLKR